MPPTGRRVAVVGSGPASLAVAEELSHVGHSVVIYEEWPKPGGLLHYGIPSFKLDKDIVMAKIAHLEFDRGQVHLQHARWTRYSS